MKLSLLVGKSWLSMDPREDTAPSLEAVRSTFADQAF